MAAKLTLQQLQDQHASTQKVVTALTNQSTGLADKLTQLNARLVKVQAANAAEIATIQNMLDTKKQEHAVNEAVLIKNIDFITASQESVTLQLNKVQTNLSDIEAQIAQLTPPAPAT